MFNDLERKLDKHLKDVKLQGYRESWIMGLIVSLHRDQTGLSGVFYTEISQMRKWVDLF